MKKIFGPKFLTKNFVIKDNIIENLSDISTADDLATYGVYPFALANFDGPNRDTTISFSYVGNRVVK